MKSKYALVGLMFLGLVGCAEKAINQNIDQKLKQENSVKSNADLTAEANQLLNGLPGLTDDQKTKLTALRVSLHNRSAQYRDESLRLRSLLLKDVLSPNDLNPEISLIKKRLRALENKRLNLIFESIDQTDAILGRNSPHREKVMKAFFDTHEG